MGRGQLPRVLRHRRARRVVQRISRMFTAVEIRLFRAGRTTIGSRVASGAPVLLLTTTGRRSGLRRTTPLLYHWSADGSILLVAANGAADWDPDWLNNLRAHPEVQVELDGEHRRADATVLEAEARVAAWDEARRAFSTLDDAQQATSRPISLVRLVVRRPG